MDVRKIEKALEIMFNAGGNAVGSGTCIDSPIPRVKYPNEWDRAVYEARRALEDV